MAEPTEDQPIPCCDCGAPGPTWREMETVGADIAIHECETSTWELLTVIVHHRGVGE